MNMYIHMHINNDTCIYITVYIYIIYIYIIGTSTSHISQDDDIALEESYIIVLSGYVIQFWNGSLDAIGNRDTGRAFNLM